MSSTEWWTHFNIGLQWVELVVLALILVKVW